ncbi:MAG TPA: DUF6064 family protein [bacterium]
MGEWWTYRVADFVMFAPRTYYRLFALYNADVWPAHIMGLAAGVAIVALVLRPRVWGGRVIAALLALGWLWVAAMYLHPHYATIHWAADDFAMAFVAQALLLAWLAARGGVTVRARPTGVAWVGMATLVYAVALQPLVGPLLTRPWQQAEVFGMAPDPTVIGTLGVLMAAERAHWLLLPIPVLWCAYNAATLAVLGSPETVALAIAGALALWAATHRTLAARRSAALRGPAG